MLSFKRLNDFCVKEPNFIPFRFLEVTESTKYWFSNVPLRWQQIGNLIKLVKLLWVLFCFFALGRSTFRVCVCVYKMWKVGCLDSSLINILILDAGERGILDVPLPGSLESLSQWDQNQCMMSIPNGELVCLVSLSVVQQHYGMSLSLRVPSSFNVKVTVKHERYGPCLITTEAPVVENFLECAEDLWQMLRSVCFFKFLGSA